MMNSNVKVEMKNLVIAGVVVKEEGQNVYVQDVQGGVYKFHKDIVQEELSIGALSNKVQELIENISEVAGVSKTSTKKITGGYGSDTAIYEICNKVMKYSTGKWLEEFTSFQLEGTVELLQERLKELNA